METADKLASAAGTAAAAAVDTPAGSPAGSTAAEEHRQLAAVRNWSLVGEEVAASTAAGPVVAGRPADLHNPAADNPAGMLVDDRVNMLLVGSWMGTRGLTESIARIPRIDANAQSACPVRH